MSKFAVITRFAGRTGLLIKKNAPTILTMTGIAGGVTAAVLGAKAALKSEGQLDELKKDIEDVKRVAVDNEDRVKGMTFYYVKHGKQVLRTYGPALAVGSVSIASILWGHGIMKGRNAALMASYAAMERSFAAYRDRVRRSLEEHPELVDKIWASGIQKTGEQDENGDDIYEACLDNRHPYVHFFDEGNPEWSEDMDYNINYLKIKERMWNDKLITRGHVFLNEVLEDLGIPHTSEGALVGWLFNGNGDGFIDFNMNRIKENHDRFLMSLDKCLVLEFNVDGVIYDRI